MPSFNMNNSAVKRIMQEARELATDPCTDYSAAPLEDDIFEWHCTLRGPAGTEFEGGLYHFRILLPAEYPFRPPSIMMLTPNGRFELNSKICISFTNYHEELWQPAWGVRTAIIGLQGFFPLKGQAAVGIGSIEYPAAERKRLAVLSRDWACPHCKQTNYEILPDPPTAHPPITDSPTTTTTTTATTTTTTAAAAAAAAAATTTPPSPPEAHLRPKPSSVSRRSSESPGPTAPSEPDVTIHTVHPTAPPTRTHSSMSLDSLVVREESASAASSIHTQAVRLALLARPTTTTTTTSINTTTTRARKGQASVAHRLPLLLDTTLCVLLVLTFALVCRKFL